MYRHETEIRKAAFDRWIRHAQGAAETPEEVAILHNLEANYEDYDKKRQEVIVLHDIGEIATADWIFRNEVNACYDRAYQLCEELVEASPMTAQLARLEFERHAQILNTWHCSTSVNRESLDSGSQRSQQGGCSEAQKTGVTASL